MARDDCCYLCNECPNSFPTLDELEHHMAEDHSKPATFSDASSSPAFDDSTIDTDVKMELDMNDITKPIPGHSPTSSDSSHMSDVDVTSANPGVPPALFTGARIVGHSCRICGRAFSDRGQLNVHYTHTHRDKPQYECEFCQRVFCIKRELSTHLRIHSGEQPHKCDQCGKEFGTRQLLKKHNMWHTGERSHVCKICNKSFFQKGHLTQHLMIHNGERRFKCQQCDKTFVFKFDLNRHLKIHLERGHTCNKCGKSFLKKVSLDEHSPKCKRSIGTPQSASTRTSTPLSDVSRQVSPATTPISRRMSSTSIQIPALQQPQAIQFTGHINGDSSPNEGAVAPASGAMFNNPFLLSQLATKDDSVAKNFLQYQQEHQHRLMMMSAAQKILSMNQAINNQNNGNYNCALCNKTYPNAAAYTVHWSLTHMRMPDVSTSQTSDDETELKLNLTKQDDLHMHSDSATSSSCASSPQKVSPISQTDLDSKYCDQCDLYRGKNMELEKELLEKTDELARLRDTFNRFTSGTLQFLNGQQQQQTLTAIPALTTSFDIEKMWKPQFE
uniref:Protein krueppel n=1 Tax=Panagrellus redivivus TaxID=6233 RepID=A0A7E4UT87_PANRE